MRVRWAVVLYALILWTLPCVAGGGSPVPYVLTAVFWEGTPLQEANWTALAELTRQYPEMSLVHFFTPVHFLRSKADAPGLAARIKGVLRPEDTAGIQLSGWKSLVEAAGVPFLSTPTFWGAPLHCETGDCGHEVPLSAYREVDWKKILSYGVGVLKEQGIVPRVFLAGGHMNTEAMVKYLPEIGIASDFSGIDPTLLAPAFRKYPWFQMVSNRWADGTLFSIPKRWQTSHGPVVQFYQTLGSIDTLSMATFQQRYTDLVRSGSTGPVILFWGFHFETIGKNLNKVLEAMAFVREFHQRAALAKKSCSTLLEDAAAFPY